MNPLKTSIALGAFDGLHLGHRAVLAAALNGGADYIPTALSFEFPPAGGPGVMPLSDRQALLARMGFEKLITLRIEDVRDMPAETFVKDFLFKKCHAGQLACGEDFRFGSGAKGDVELLMTLCAQAGVTLRVAPQVSDAEGKISSTRIRAAVESGDILTANRLLGRPFGFAGEVIHGNHLGTGMGTPTINQAYPKGLAVPKFGVYAAWCRVNGADFFGVTNIGVKPTVGSDRVLAETWMPDFSGDIYGRQVRLFLLDFIRPERKFANLDELKAVIFQNAEQAREIAENQPLSGWPKEELLD